MGRAWLVAMPLWFKEQDGRVKNHRSFKVMTCEAKEVNELEDQLLRCVLRRPHSWPNGKFKDRSSSICVGVRRNW